MLIYIVKEFMLIGKKFKKILHVLEDGARSVQLGILNM